VTEPRLTVNFDHAIDDVVRVKALEVEGRVEQVLFDGCGPQYLVAHWYDGNKRSIWMWDSEIEEPQK